MPRESKFQSDVIRRLKSEFPGCLVLKNDPTYIQGIPDLSILFENRWATLEVKRSHSEPYRPNQEYYVDLMRSMSYSDFIFPENEERVFDELQVALYHRR